MSADLAVVSFNVVPEQNLTAKYDRLGRMGLVNRRMWCDRHGYLLVESAPEPDGWPACWGKLALLEATLAHHEWVLWADSDALVLDLALDAERFCDNEFDLVTQSMDAVHELAGLAVDEARARWPVNTGVFLLRATKWSLDLLRRAAGRTDLLRAPAPGPWQVWDGIGDQEAINAALGDDPEDRRRVAVVDGLQSHPRTYRPGRDLFVHLWGNHAAYRIPHREAEAVLTRWERAIERGGPFPTDLAAFHWACIQNRTAEIPFDRGGPERFLYAAGQVPPKCGVPPIWSE